MPNFEFSALSRREYLHRAGMAVGAAALGNQGVLGQPSAAADAAAEGIPRRVLGRTKVPISILTLGTAPAGQSKFYTARQVADIDNNESIGYYD
jgi:hypothetical protein